MQAFTLIDRRLGKHKKEKIIIGMNIIDRCTYGSFRQYLKDTFGVPRRSKITYIDGDGDEILIEGDPDFGEAIKEVKMVRRKQGVPLIVTYIYYNKLNLKEESLSLFKKEYWKTSDLEAILFPTSTPINAITKVKDTATFAELLLSKEIQHMKTLSLKSQKKNKQCLEQSKVQCSNSTKKIDDCIETQKAAEKIIAEMRETLEKFRNMHSSLKQCSDTSPPSPPSWFTHYMESMKQDMISTITHKVTENLTKTLNERLDRLEPLISDEIDQMRLIRSQFYIPKQYSRNPDFSENNQKRKKTQDEKQFNVALPKCPKEEKIITLKDNTKRKLRETLSYGLEQYTKDMLYLKKKPSYIFTDLINQFNKKEQERSVQIVNMSEECASQRNLPSQIEKNTEEAFQSQKIFDSDLRMNCSIIGHQMLDKDRCKDRRYCSISDIDNISCCSNNSNVTNDQEEDSFEVIETPNIEHSEKPAKTEKENDSNRDSPSFELLSDTPSSPFSMYEDHFSINEGDLQPSEETELSRNIPHVVNINNEIYDKDPSRDLDKHINTDLEKHVELGKTNIPNKNANVLFCDHTNDFDTFDFDVKEPSKEQEDTQVNHPDMCNQNKQNDSKGTQYPEEPSSYPMMSSQCIYQSQTDSVDSILSFHSHTTSVTDDPYADDIASRIQLF